MGQPVPLNTLGSGGGDQEGEGRQEERRKGKRKGGREAFRAFGAAIFLNVCSNTIPFSLRVKARILPGSYIICPQY